MPQAVTHILLTIIVLDLFRDYVLKNKRIMPLHFIFLGGVAGLLPDIDIPIYWMLKNVLGLNVSWFHGTITHTVWIPIILAIAAAALFWHKRNAAVLLWVISFGLFFHIFLDLVLRGVIMPFWPLSSWTMTGIMANSGIAYWDFGLDAIILLAWLWHEEKMHKISDFI
ncbi:MAG: metal-dependent hydrolase [Candidatus Woesearchaeota archaeon]